MQEFRMLLRPISLLILLILSYVSAYERGLLKMSTESGKQALKSLQNLATLQMPQTRAIDWAALENFIRNKMQLNYKDWSSTCLWADELSSIIGGPADEHFRVIFERCLSDGNWMGALEYARKQEADHRPWIVLVTGLNGIRKTTTMYQPWFPDVLKEALGYQDKDAVQNLPTGENSFFRQLDYMIATLANEEFRELYTEAPKLSTSEYSAKKDIIFKRYRTLAEVLGVLLLRAAQDGHMNALVETSGRDIASFEYVDALFDTLTHYQKLVLHFTIDDLRYAARSVDARMEGEMLAGATAAASSARAIVGVNAGGPYGSEVLHSVRADSDRVWAKVSRGEGGTLPRAGWLKACIAIQGSDDPGAWTARAVLPDGSNSNTVFAFSRKTT